MEFKHVSVLYNEVLENLNNVLKMNMYSTAVLGEVSKVLW